MKQATHEKRTAPYCCDTISIHASTQTSMTKGACIFTWFKSKNAHFSLCWKNEIMSHFNNITYYEL